MRVGRDHIASTVYTIAFATAGASLPVLLLIAIYNRPLFQVLQTEQFAAELIRTMIGSIGLILAVPLTTAIGVAVVRASRTAKTVRAPKVVEPTPGSGQSSSTDGDSAQPEAAEHDSSSVDGKSPTSDPAADPPTTDRPTSGGDDDATTVLPKQSTRLRRRTRSKDDDYNFSDLRDPD
jgi:hypothetical protein